MTTYDNILITTMKKIMDYDFYTSVTDTTTAMTKFTSITFDDLVKVIQTNFKTTSIREVLDMMHHQRKLYLGDYEIIMVPKGIKVPTTMNIDSSTQSTPNTSNIPENELITVDFTADETLLEAIRIEQEELLNVPC